MPKDYFSFKKFTISQAQSAMKVGTDSVLLAAWINIRKPDFILDIGTGTGILSLLMAQRYTEAKITALEISKEAIKDAQENVKNSPWSDRIKITEGDFCQFESELKFDLIICNPPYFENSLHSPSMPRNKARHSDALPFPVLASGVQKVLSKGGTFAMILPFENAELMRHLAFEQKLYTCRQTLIYTKENTPAKRVLFQFTPELQLCQTDSLTIYTNSGTYTLEYRALVEEYYQKMKLSRE